VPKWFFADRSNRVNAAVGTDWHFSVRTPANVGPKILRGRRVRILFSEFQRPLLFCRVKQPEIVDARVHFRRGRNIWRWLIGVLRAKVVNEHTVWRALCVGGGLARIDVQTRGVRMIQFDGEASSVRGARTLGGRGNDSCVGRNLVREGPRSIRLELLLLRCKRPVEWDKSQAKLGEKDSGDSFNSPVNSA